MDLRQSKNSTAEKICLAAVIAVLVMFFALFTYMNFVGFTRVAQADMYEDTLIAKLMWDQKTLFPDGYIFGNQIYVIATPVLAALFYGLTGSINIGMALATAVMSALIVLCFFWMLRPAVKNTLHLCCGLLMLVSSPFAPYIVSVARGQLFFVMCSYYACYLITLLFVFGDYIRARQSTALRPAALILSLLLCFATGMQSLRQTCIMVLPLLAFELLIILYGFITHTDAPVKKEQTPLIRVCAYLAANIAGVLFPRLLDIPQQTIFTEPAEVSRLRAVWLALRGLTGYDTVITERQPLFALMLIFHVLILAAAFIILLRGRTKDGKGVGILWWLCVISILAVIAASLLTSVSIRDIYLFVYYVLLALSVVIVLLRGGRTLRITLAVLLCAVSLCNLKLSYGGTVTRIRDEAPTPQERICRYALDNGYKYIYGQDAASPGVAVCSDGKLIAGVWQNDVIFKAVPYLNIRTIYSLDDYDKALFIFFDDELELAKVETEGNGAVLTVVDRFGQYTVCSSSKQLMYPLTWPNEWPKYFATLEGQK